MMALCAGCASLVGLQHGQTEGSVHIDRKKGEEGDRQREKERDRGARMER